MELASRYLNLLNIRSSCQGNNCLELRCTHSSYSNGLYCWFHSLLNQPRKYKVTFTKAETTPAYLFPQYVSEELLNLLAFMRTKSVIPDYFDFWSKSNRLNATPSLEQSKLSFQFFTIKAWVNNICLNKANQFAFQDTMYAKSDIS